MEGSLVDDVRGAQSWEVADLDETMSRLMVKDFNNKQSCSSTDVEHQSDVINSVDQFLREALQNPRERLSILRMEQDVEKFIRDPTQHQLEFQQLPTSYLRLAAHRIAQHYSLQSMVMLDNSLPDSSGSRIIVHKTSECRLPKIRLADIPVSLPSEDSGIVKVAIKQRPQKRSQIVGHGNSNYTKTNSSKSVEERKEEYVKARARIFNSTSGSTAGGGSGRQEVEPRLHDGPQHGLLLVSKPEEKSVPGISDTNPRRVIESSTSNARSVRNRMDKEPVGRYKPNNRVAIFRDREVDRKDPDYDRSYDRYMQRFDPGFGFNGGPYALQPMFTPAINYNTEFPQLGSSHRPQVVTEHQPRPLPQHLPGPWSAPATPAGIGFSHPETIMPTFNPNHVGARSAPSMYLHSSQYQCQRPGIPFIHAHEHVQPFTQSHQQQADASFGLARPH